MMCKALLLDNLITINLSCLISFMHVASFFVVSDKLSTKRALATCIISFLIHIKTACISIMYSTLHAKILTSSCLTYMPLM